MNKLGQGRTSKPVKRETSESGNERRFTNNDSEFVSILLDYVVGEAQVEEAAETSFFRS